MVLKSNISVSFSLYLIYLFLSVYYYIPPDTLTIMTPNMKLFLKSIKSVAVEIFIDFIWLTFLSLTSIEFAFLVTLL